MNMQFAVTPMGFLICSAIATALASSFIPEASLAGKSNGEQMLAKADHIRNPSSSYRMRIGVKSEDDEREFDVFLKGTDKTLIVAKEPARMRGQNMLMLDRDFYAYVPNLKKSLRLSLSQKMMGLVANGDIARTRWSGDYTVFVEKGDAKETQMLLNGTKKNLTYQKIRLWLDTSTSRPLRAEYLSLNGKAVLKKAAFEEYKTLAGSQRPSRIRIEDAGGKQSTIVIQDMESSDLDESTFTLANLEKAK